MRERHAWVLHVIKEPFHYGLRVTVPHGEQHLLAAELQETLLQAGQAPLG